MGLLKDSDWSIRRRAAQTLGSMGASIGSPARSHVSEVAALLKDANPVVRACAADALGQMGTAAEKHVNDLAKCLCKENEGDGLVRAAALQALACVGPASLQSIALVREALEDEVPRTRYVAGIAFQCMGGMLSREEGPAKDILASEDPKTREAAARALSIVAQLQTHLVGF